MSQIRFDQINNNEGNDGNFRVGFFSLKNDGDEAIVRIMHDSTDTFDIVTTHPVQIGNKYRRVNCIRDPRDPLDNCPLCKSGSKIQQRLYIHLIQYVKDDQGNIVPQGKVWERAASYAVTLKNLIDEYGPLSNCIFKIRRNGEAGSMQTTYSILYGNPQVYRNDIYPTDPSIFEGYSAVGTAVMDKNFDELAEFMATGEFPASQNQNTQAQVVPQNAPVNYQTVQPQQVPYVAPPVQTMPTQAPYVAPQVDPNVVQPTITQPNPYMPPQVTNDPNATMNQPQRPVRYY